MKGDNVVSGLIRRRRELGRDIREHQEAIERLRIDMAAIDHVLLVWRPSLDLEGIAPLGSNRSVGIGRNAVSRVILSLLRAASESVGTTELTRRVMAARGVSEQPLPDHRRSVRKSLRKLEAQGLVRSSQVGSSLQWEVVR